PQAGSGRPRGARGRARGVAAARRSRGCARGDGMNHGSSDKRRQLLVYGGLGAAAALAGGVAAWWQLAPRPSSDRAVDILYAQTLEGLDGRSYAFEQWRGRRLVVNFWATWCPPCVEEMPELEALRQEFDGRAQ